MKRFDSFLVHKLEEFIAYREHLGYEKKTSLSHLRTFDRYLTKKKPVEEVLPPSFFLELRADLKIESRSVNRVLSTVRVFFQFLVRQGYYPENPLQDIPYLQENSIIPFVFSPAETDQLLAAICKKLRKSRWYYLKDLSGYLAILLLARCGLRISEPLRLQLHHYRPQEKTISIQKTKFKKDRLIPVPKSVVMQIENYLAVRHSLLPNSRNPYLLAGNDRKGLNDHRIRAVFHQAVKNIRLDQPRRIIGNTNFSSPTPHSLRHSFAVNILKCVKEKGGCPQNALPVLAIYMGHSEYKHTVKYLKVLDAKQRQGLANFAGLHQEQT
ncbi:MAG: tyrosine-type recombinase/integrase [Desulforhopalus sp.]|jgi:site-specific recombinase XerD|nr:tyrosine-type recombinase/integrase [Desulforhopalus sp.]